MKGMNKLLFTNTTNKDGFFLHVHGHCCESLMEKKVLLILKWNHFSLDLMNDREIITETAKANLFYFNDNNHSARVFLIK